MSTYFESSALVKLVIPEQGTETAELLWDTAVEAVTSRLSYAEVRASLAAAFRSGRLTRLGLAEAKGSLNELVAEMKLVEVSDGVVRRAGDLAEQYALRGFDALHLASALSLRPGPLVTWDRELVRAARRVGMTVAGPRAQ